MNTRTYRQASRATDAAARTQRIFEAGLALFVERPFDQITLAAVAERADVGLQTVIRRVGTKDGLVEAIHAWIVPQIGADLGPPSAEPGVVADAVARHNDRWGRVIMRTLQQEDVSPALAASAASGRTNHREWIAACFAPSLAHLGAEERRLLTVRLVAICGTELWTVLTRDQALSTDEARRAVDDLITATLADAASRP